MGRSSGIPVAAIGFVVEEDELETFAVARGTTLDRASETVDELRRAIGGRITIVWVHEDEKV